MESPGVSVKEDDARAYREKKAQSALQDIATQMAYQWASGIEKRPTQQLVLQKLIDPVVRHILSTIFPWVVGVAICFLILLICTVVTCFIVLRSGSWSPVVAAASVAIR